MSYQAMEAVQDHSRYTDDTPENFAPFKIMLAIARYADRTGVAGVPGDYKKCPSFRAIAKTANVHRNTVGTWIPQLVESGELVIESGGSGRASWTVYYIQLPIDDDIRAAEPETMAQGTAQTTAQGMAQAIETMAQEMAQWRQLMAQGMAQAPQTMAQDNGTNGTSLQSNSGQIHDPDSDPDDPQIQTDPTRDPVDLGQSRDETGKNAIAEPFDWPAVLDCLKDAMIKPTFEANFRGTTAIARDGTLEIITTNQYQADWINGRLKELVSRTVCDLTGKQLGVYAHPARLRETVGRRDR